MPKILILTSSNDISAPRFEKEAKNNGFDSEILYYDQLFLESLPDVKIPVTDETYLIPRSPYTANKIEQNFVSLLDQVLENYSFKKVLDKKLYRQSFIQYDDKFFQNYFFKQNQVPYSQLVNPTQCEKSMFPIIAKKRIASRASSNFIIFNATELTNFILRNDISQYIFQKFYELKSDYRVLVAFGKIIATVKRTVTIKEGNRPTVQVSQPVTDFPTEISDYCIQLAQKMGCGFCGFDVGQKQNDSFFFIEFNPSPQFLGVERETNKNIAKQIIQYLTS